MFNRVHNQFFIKNSGSELDRFKDLVAEGMGKDGEIFNAFLPSPSYGDFASIESQIPLAYSTAQSSSKGCSLSWRQAINLWRMEKWGVVWDALNFDIIYLDDSELCISFDTPTDWPLAIYKKINEDFPNLLLLISSWSLDGNFVKYGAIEPKGNWVIEDVGALHDESFQPFNIDPSQKILDVAKQFEGKFQTKFSIGNHSESQNELR